MNRITIAAWCGVALHASCFSLAQDYMGQDGCIKAIANHWVSAWFTVPLAVIAVVVSCAVLWIINERES